MRTYVVLSYNGMQDIVSYAGNNPFDAEIAFDQLTRTERKHIRLQTWINGEHVSTRFHDDT